MTRRRRRLRVLDVTIDPVSAHGAPSDIVHTAKQFGAEVLQEVVGDVYGPRYEAGSLLGAFRLCAATQHFPPSLPFFGFVLCFLVNKGGFFSSIRVARSASAYDIMCGVTPCDLLLIEVAFFWQFIVPSIPAGFQEFRVKNGRDRRGERGVEAACRAG